MALREMMRLLSLSKKIGTVPVLEAVALILLLVAGIGLRLNGEHTPFVSSNVDTFYFHRSAILVQTGEFPKYDSWGFAPDIRTENTPPLLGYASWIGWFLWKILGGQNDFLVFADYFPVMMYVIWALSVFFIAKRLGIGSTGAILLTALVSSTPTAVAVTAYGRYFEEIVGAPLLFLAVLLFLFVKRLDWVFWMGTAMLTLFVLSWQAFPFFYAAAIAILFFGLLIGDRNREAFIARSLFLVLPLLFAEGAVRIFVGNSYSAFGMLGEFVRAVLERNSPEMLIAMQRRDWRNVGLGEFVDYFGYAGIMLAALGVAVSFFRPKDFAMRSTTVLGFAGIFLVSLFYKFRHFAFGLFAAPLAIGAMALIDFGFHAQEIGDFLRESILWVKRSKTLLARVVLAVSAAGLLGASWAAIVYYRMPEPVARVDVRELPESTATVKSAEIILTNLGGITSRNAKAFTGMHIAVAGGEILESEPFAQGREEPNLGTKSFSKWGKVNFFEVSKSRMRTGESWGVRLSIRKTGTEPVRIYWRGWLPKYRCSLSDRREGIKDLRVGWRDLSSGWRNEKCIVRIPANDDASYSICPDRVFAAHLELQEFRCGVKEL